MSQNKINYEAKKKNNKSSFKGSQIFKDLGMRTF